jgi:hypothetical protein
LEANGQGGKPVGGVICFGGFATLSEPLRRAAWPPRFRSEASAHFNESSDGLRNRHPGAQRRCACHGQLVPDGYEGRASLVALGVAPGVQLVLEKSLRVLPRQVRFHGARAQGSV